MHNRIKEIREGQKMTQQEFADKLKISKSNLASYETGRRNPSSAVITLICNQFGYNELWLRTGEGEPKEKILDIDSTRVAVEILMKNSKKNFPKIVLALAEMYAEMDEIDRAVMDRNVDILLEKLKEKETGE